MKGLAGVVLPAVLIAGALASGAGAQTVGVSMASFDDRFLTVLRTGLEDYAATLPGVTLQVEDAGNDPGAQFNQIQTFLGSGVDAIIVNAVDTDATVVMSLAATDAGIPLVFVNRQPINVDDLPEGQAFVASDETESGTLETQEVCRLLKQAGKGEAARVLVLVGDLSNQAARQRTEDIHDVIAAPACGFMSIVEEQAANWSRERGADMMRDWLAAEIAFDAVIANNDEMALGAIAVMKAAGVDMDTVIVAGIDATEDAMAAMAAGDLDVTVFQNAAGQGKGALDAALALARGEHVERRIPVPFELVTPENFAKYRTMN